MARVTKTMQIKKYLEEHKRITSLYAFERFHTTRLPSIIFNLRKRGLDIETVYKMTKDCNGNTCQYAEYLYFGEEENGRIKKDNIR